MSKITGDGFSRDDFDETERARLREAHHEFTDMLPTAKPFFNMLRSAKTLATTIGVMTVLGAAAAYAAKMGLF